ncbi:acyl-CoA dehydrogenase family protein [Constantimarinum furrinae]|uniref:Glutaryl-CoA dehydrogenase n=1 Tax=Constantimarinum furrinae TaxID=2562285 RepID=A0A7G8PSI7_9FLAO|nr:acyl-CoA dehydrogenase family protein [Constantimarinum furrinae]QNJ97303.1 glutaryl-CoA dehydrogenase [Constantimarinum furrinae]
MSIFKKIKQTIALMREVDLDALGKISEKIDLPEVMAAVGELDDRQLQGLMKMLKSQSKKGQHKLPPIDGDFYDLSLKLSDEQRELQLEVRQFMEKEVKPIANKYWNKAEFPFEIIPKMAELNICGMAYKGIGSRDESFLMEGIVAMELARIDVSISTFFGVHSGLAMGSIYLCGSDSQKEEWLPKMQKMELIGAFGLTEPDVGSAVAGGLGTTCRQEGDEWVLNGQKKWIGNATFADVTVIWARDEETNRVKGFLVRKGNPGFKAEKMEDKMALRTVQNALIMLTDCRIPESDRLQKCDSFKDTAKVLKMTRAAVAWQAVGCSRGAYESALKYTKKREQFGRPIAAFQLIQNHLVEMVANLTAMQTLCFRLSEMQDQGIMTDEHASLAKVFCSMRTRDVVSRAREVMGGNGILLEYDVARFVADAEAIYSYEGTKEINSLIVGRAITGYSAFVS